MGSKKHFDWKNDKNLEQCVVQFLEKVDSMGDSRNFNKVKLLPAKTEMKTLELWRSIISECLASFLYVFIVCGAASTSAASGSFPQTTFVTAAASGFTVAVLTYCFQHLSGCHINPAVSLPMAVTRKITPVRAFLFVIAQLGGSVAGAALLYGVSAPTHYGNLNATVAQLPTHMTPWEKFSMEFVLTFLIVFTYSVSNSAINKRWMGNSSISMGFAYFATGLVSMPSLNPARAFGPAFVMNRWDHHWVFWLGPCVGGLIAALVHEVIFITHKKKYRTEMSISADSASIGSDAETYDPIEKPRVVTLQTVRSSGDLHQHVRTVVDGKPYGSLYRNGPCKPEVNDPIYEGSRSLYTRSPALTRANLGRSQSVYSKNHPTVVQRGETLSRPGPLIPAHSLYQMSDNNPINENHQNQQRQGVEGIYASRNPTTRERDREKERDIYKWQSRAESAYSTIKKQQECNASDTTYNSYHSSSSAASSKQQHQQIPIHEGSNKREMHRKINPPPYYHNQPSPGSLY